MIYLRVSTIGQVATNRDAEGFSIPANEMLASERSRNWARSLLTSTSTRRVSSFGRSTPAPGDA